MALRCAIANLYPAKLYYLRSWNEPIAQIQRLRPNFSSLPKSPRKDSMFQWIF